MIRVRIRFSVVGKLLCKRIRATLGCNCHDHRRTSHILGERNDNGKWVVQ